MYHYRPYKKKKKSKTKRILLTVFALLFILILVVVVKTLTYPFAGYTIAESEPLTYELQDSAAMRLSKAIRIPTVSEDINKEIDNPFDHFKAFLPEAFPAVYKSLDTLSVNKYGLLLHWKGKDATRKPILFLAHYDVVPATGYNTKEEQYNEEIFRPREAAKSPISDFQTSWLYPPFSGAVADGRVYGRGALDLKSTLLAQLEAVNALLVDSFRPEQDIWFAYGFDEETGGSKGATQIAAYFKQKNIEFDAVYDEGGAVMTPGIAGINRPIALVGVAEKGICIVNITVRAMGGHSSMPPRKSSLVLAAEIIEKLNKQQLPAQIIPPVQSLMDHVGGSMSFVSQMAIANQWLLEAPLLNILEQNPATNAFIRTVTAVTMAKGSDAPNMLSSTADITVNFRILTGETVEMVVDHVQAICAGYDALIKVEMSREPSRLSSEDTRAYRAIQHVMGRIYPEASVAPYITSTATDAQKYESVSRNIYRIMPVFLNEYELRTIHDENEYISLENYRNMILYFKNLMETFETTE